MANENDPLEIQRRLMFESLNSLLGFYGRPEGQALMTQMQDRAVGLNQPFTPQVVNNMLGENADATNQSYQSERELIARAMANAGLSGSGLQGSANVNALRKANAATRAGRREITTRAQLENYQAQERAQMQVQSYLAQKQANEAAARAQEVALRAQMTMEGDAANTTAQAGNYQQPNQGPNGQSIVAGPSGVQGTSSPQNPGQAAGTAPAPAPPPPRPASYGWSNRSPMMATRQVAQPYGNGGFQMVNMQDQQQYQQQQQQIAMDRAFLAQQQAQWDAQYGGR